MQLLSFLFLGLLTLAVPGGEIRADQAQKIANTDVALTPPIEGLKLSELHDTFDELHFGHRHEAIDIMKPRGTAIHPVAGGTIRKLHFSKAGGNTIYQFGDDAKYCYYYAHLDRYAEGLHEGQHVSTNDVIGYVGTSGDAAPNAPQLHFAINLLAPDKRWWHGTPIDPYPLLVKAVETQSAQWRTEQVYSR
jgi:murein DD-endopeptidase MepM/ murein hydrolase activator NlpD